MAGWLAIIARSYLAMIAVITLKYISSLAGNKSQRRKRNKQAARGLVSVADRPYWSLPLLLLRSSAERLLDELTCALLLLERTRANTFRLLKG